ncbi:DUF5996 family protein [Desertihabitans aurantiacus]|uniref:DUF5996 family protein n=1 Tax=Desertihabitans aurantiacus TaxID=2282477 RepID=UPI000DF82775|nr:DUF5996 family protein [Desertihabitans aurantiacus]
MTTTDVTTTSPTWPALRVEDWTATRDTLHMWTQVVGKIRMAHAPLLNHWWQVTLYVNPRGLTTGSIAAGERLVDLELDFVDHQLRIRTSDGGTRSVRLEPKSVARFHAETLQALRELGVEAEISALPNEVHPAIPFAEDHEHASYDPDAVQAFWRQLVQADRLINEFRSHFVGKVSPVHFFWGSFDLACTRFSGRPAPEHPGGAPNCGDWVMVEGYSRELSSCGFWPGGGEEGAFYAYAYPEPAGFAEHPVRPEAAYYDSALRQFLLPYEAVRTSADPDRTVLDFLQSTYEAAADHGGWDRVSLEDDPTRWDHVR